MKSSVLVLTIVLVVLASPASTQEPQSGAREQAKQQKQIAEKCYGDLGLLGQRMREDGYWLTGIRDRWGMGGWRWRGRVAPGYYPRVGFPPGTDGAVTDGTTGTVVTNRPPWGIGIQASGIQIQILFRAAQVLAIRGDEQACRAVLDELTQLYQEYVDKLQKAGVEPYEVITRRQKLILTAEPVEELNLGGVSTVEITGTEIWNPEDEYLGEIEDLLISDGHIEYAVVSRDGFLGLGEDYVAVPWQRFNATPELDLFVLGVSQATLEQAPRVSANLGELTRAERTEIRQFWERSAQ